MPAGPITANIALGKAVTVSSVESSDLSGLKMTDGDTGTRWGSEYSEPQSAIIDLGATYAVNRVALAWETAAGKDYDIQIGASMSGPWTTMRSVANNSTVDAWLDYSGLTGSGRYLRINMRTRTTVWGFSLWEVQAAGTNPNSLSSDLNNDGKINVSDLGILLSNWGATVKPASDLNQDDKVDTTDLSILLATWG